MRPNKARTRPVIVLGVTADTSLGLMSGFPEYLVSCGWDVHLVSNGGTRLSELSSVPGITTHTIPMRREPAPLGDLLSLLRWLALFRKVRPDLVSVGTPKAGLLGSVAGLLARVPHRIYLLRGLRLETTSGLTRQMLLTLERVAAKASHEVIAVSRSLRDQAVELGIGDSNRTYVLGLGSSNGVDTRQFAPYETMSPETRRITHSLGLEEGIPVIGFVGRLTKDKGLPTLAKAREILTTRGVDHQLLVIGELDSEQDAPIVEALSTTGRSVIATGHVRTTRDYYPLIDVLCLPTLREGFPNVVLEAGAMAIPAVTTKATGAIDSVVDGETGIIVPKSNPTALADALEALVRDPALRMRLGVRAREWVVKNFDRHEVWELLETHYRRGASRSTGPLRNRGPIRTSHPDENKEVLNDKHSTS